MIINLIDTLEPNTTYTFNFGESVSDITEKNVPDNLILAFSTGNKLDTGIIRGTVMGAENHLPSKKGVVIGLYEPSDTLDPKTQKPTYYTKADKQGKFLLSNLPQKEFRIFAFTDKNLNKTFDPSRERIAFNSNTIRPYFDSTETQMFLVDQNFSKPQLIRGFPGLDSYRLTFSKGLMSFKILSTQVPFVLRNSNKEVFLFPPQQDSLELNFSITDSLGAQKDSTTVIFLNPEGKPYDDSGGLSSVPRKGGELLRGDSILILPTVPIQSIDIDSILYIKNNDTLSFKKEVSETLVFPWYWKPLPKLQSFGVIFKKGSLINVLGDTLRKISLSYSYKIPENYGQVEGSVNTLESCYVIDILSNDFQLQGRLINPKEFIFRGLPPGNYKIRSLVDRNCNGVWDPGNYKSGVEPEKFHFYDEELQLKANWVQQDKLVEF